MTDNPFAADYIDPATPSGARAMFADALKLPPIERIIQRGHDTASAVYLIHFDGGRLARLRPDDLYSQAGLAKALMVQLGVMPEPVKPAEYRTALAGLLLAGAIEQVRMDDEGLTGSLDGWMHTYLDHAGSDRDTACAAGEPFTEDGRVHVRAEHLAGWIRREFREQVKLSELRGALLDLGYERRSINYRRKKVRSTISYYVGTTDYTATSAKTADGEGESS